MFSKILIANRGEIACRIMATARRLGIETVAVYSEADRDALHVRLADEAHCIGPPPPKQSYLNGAALIQAAWASGAQAIHPGYGFLSEDADFAETILDAGLVFIGPPPQAIHAMGSKRRAKALMQKAGVPVVPGYHGAKQDLASLRKEAASIGYPVLIKVSAGGGGKGMRIVGRAADLKDAIASARREARSSFGDGALILEKFLDRPRHIEVQVFADSHGNFLHMGERDCSLQRRHQKIVEETGDLGLADGLLDDLEEAALAVAEAVGYVGAGTVEFLLDPDGAFYFMEMNTRLQVEHPITEMVTGEDLVEWQLRVAAGQPLPRDQIDVQPSGHAIEARLYAEDPSAGFLPSSGTIRHFRIPDLDDFGGAVRIDTGFGEGDAVSVHYDPLIAKVCAWAETRAGSRRLLRRVLDGIDVSGIGTNLDFLRNLFRNRSFVKGITDTGFVERHVEALTRSSGKIPDTVFVLSCLDLMLKRSGEASRNASRSQDPHSPWHMTHGWRINGDNHHDLTFLAANRQVDISVHYRGLEYQVEWKGKSVDARGAVLEDGLLRAEIDGQWIRGAVDRQGEDIRVLLAGRSYHLQLIDPVARAAQQEVHQGDLRAPLPGVVTKIFVKPGQDVSRGMLLLIVEAMKMEHAISAPGNGIIETLNCTVGEQVDEGYELLSIKD